MGILCLKEGDVMYLHAPIRTYQHLSQGSDDSCWVVCTRCLLGDVPINQYLIKPHLQSLDEADYMMFIYFSAAELEYKIYQRMLFCETEPKPCQRSHQIIIII